MLVSGYVVCAFIILLSLYYYVEPECIYGLLECEVSQYYAELLLRPVDRFNYEEFMECWRQSVPDGINTNIDYLRVNPLIIVNIG